MFLDIIVTFADDSFRCDIQVAKEKPINKSSISYHRIPHTSKHTSAEVQFSGIRDRPTSQSRLTETQR